MCGEGRDHQPGEDQGAGHGRGLLLTRINAGKGHTGEVDCSAKPKGVRPIY